MIADSNIFIYALKPEGRKLLRFIYQRLPALSAITYVEVLGTTRLSQADVVRVQQLFEKLSILPLDRPVLDRAVILRQQRRMTIADALIAATALVHHRPLVTRNTADFAWVPGLQLLDPYANDQRRTTNDE